MSFPLYPTLSHDYPDVLMFDDPSEWNNGAGTSSKPNHWNTTSGTGYMTWSWSPCCTDGMVMGQSPDSTLVHPQHPLPPTVARPAEQPHLRVLAGHMPPTNWEMEMVFDMDYLQGMTNLRIGSYNPAHGDPGHSAPPRLNTARAVNTARAALAAAQQRTRARCALALLSERVARAVDFLSIPFDDFLTNNALHVTAETCSDFCLVIDNCGECTMASAGANTCGWCEDTGRCMPTSALASCPSTSPWIQNGECCPSCAAAVMHDCVGAPGCGWCQASGTCLSGRRAAQRNPRPTSPRRAARPTQQSARPSMLTVPLAATQARSRRSATRVTTR